MIVSILPGRVRIRHAALKLPDAVEREHALHGLAGVTHTQLNRRVGSVLVHFDAARVSTEQLVAAMGLTSTSSTRAAHTASVASSLPAWIVGSLVLTGVSGLLGLRRLHVAAGLALTIAAGVHVYQSQRAKRARRAGQE